MQMVNAYSAEHPAIPCSFYATLVPHRFAGKAEGRENLCGFLSYLLERFTRVRPCLRKDPVLFSSGYRPGSGRVRDTAIPATGCSTGSYVSTIILIINTKCHKINSNLIFCYEI